MKLRSIKGTKDILPDESVRWQKLEAAVRETMTLYNYREIRTPIFEDTALFSRSIGETTDIVSKEMYTFEDKGGQSVTLRPEGTAAALRAYVEHNLGDASPVTKVYYIGPMFRYERPQAGRLRQFHQFGAEALGSPDPSVDAEIIMLCGRTLRAAGVEQISLKLNSVGCKTCRTEYRSLLVSYLRRHESALSSDSRLRLQGNPLRVLDSKAEEDRRIITKAPVIVDHLCKDCADHFASVRKHLDASDAKYILDGTLVRGLDYYTKTAFEFTSSALGAQDAVAGGGRYDSLVKDLGGKDTPGIGFATGMERVLLAVGDASGAGHIINARLELYLVAADERARLEVFTLAETLRASGVAVDRDPLGRSVKAQLREANRLNARRIAVFGDTERVTGMVKVKEMVSGREEERKIGELASFLSSKG